MYLEREHVFDGEPTIRSQLTADKPLHRVRQRGNRRSHQSEIGINAELKYFCATPFGQIQVTLRPRRPNHREKQMHKASHQVDFLMTVIC